MIELFTLTVLTLVVLSLLRPGKTPPLDNPLIIERAGQYHMTLAPQLNLAQPLIEDIARRLGASGELAPNSATLCFEVRDKEVRAHGKDFYLLAITRRNGMLYVQAIAPQAGDPASRKTVLLEFAHAVLVNIPPESEPDEQLNNLLISTIKDAALMRSISTLRL